MNHNRSLKKNIIFILATIFFVSTAVFAAFNASAGEIDLVSRMILKNLSGSKQSSWIKASKNVGGVIFVPCLVKTRDTAATIQAIKDAGGTASVLYGWQSRTPAIVTAKIPVDAASLIASRDEVDVLEAGLPLSKKMDTARDASNVVAVQDGSALGVAYDGTNVVVGVVDDTLDYGNADFQRATGTRVQYLRQTDGTTITECTHSTIAASSCGIEDRGGGYYHGTHVTGIAAGADATYKGVAPAADIMFNFVATDDADSGGELATEIIDGAGAIFTKADVLDKPAVVNLSLGTSIGAHDGTSLLEEGLDGLVSAKGGRIIVNAAGNEQVIPADQDADRRAYVGGIHASISVPAGESRGWRMGIWSGSGSAGAFTGGTLVDVWLDTGLKDSCSIAALGYAHDRSPYDFNFPGIISTTNASFGTGDVSFANSTTEAVTATGDNVKASIEVSSDNLQNHKPHATVLFTPSGSSSTALQSLWYDVVVRSTSSSACTGHMWLYYDAVAYHDFLQAIAGTGHDVALGTNGGAYNLADGDSLYTTTIPATANNVIAVGSFMPPKPTGSTTSAWTADDGNTYLQSDLSAPGGSGSVTNDLSSFSSLGPTADGRSKPDIVAPGEPIISTLARGASMSSAYTVGETHFKEAGTSMSSPHAAGIVALLLQRNNTLTVSQVRTALQVNASKSGMTVKTPLEANSFGSGKVNAASILSSVSTDTSLYHGTGDLDGSSAGSSCGLIKDAKADIKWTLLAVMIIMVLIPSFVRGGKVH